ncbi:MAG: GlsB/YeaQ/YmgE family stress response membrane protein [Kiritimatiellae bacterium]|nr:GlsB/YeaQ/YmgE family stress response membrane protein [Kiritimatiellia bacterium]
MNNESMTLLGVVIMGGLAGWISGLLMKGSGFGLFGNIVVGILGAIFGGWLFRQLGITTGTEFLSSLITAVVGAMSLLFLISLVKRKR